MGWFTDLCRNVGLMIHHIGHPDDEKKTRQVVKKEVEEETHGKVTLRRTTIEEIEYHGDPAELKDETERDPSGE
ncbi:MAG: hypothetical protein GC159_05200 [Phycisphaera sp.]|nr:hypothetical protein [Phycisphaera sp.]